MSKLLSILLLLTSCLLLKAKESNKPNIVLIMADDLGYSDLSCYGHPKIKTPVLDNMAKEGLKLLSYYSGNTVCTPSRMALLSGSYPARLGWTKGVIGYKISTKEGMSPNVVTMAEVFKNEGYSTAICGKWHLGDLEKFSPQAQGFELAYYIKKSNNQSKILYRNEKVLEKPFQNRLLTEKFTNEAKSFIKSNKDNPFFLYIPYTAPHFPVEPHPDWQGKSKFGIYGDVVEEMDYRIGEIFDTLKSEGLDRNTIVIFTSDNGPQGGQMAQAKPYRGKKWTALEGGNRVPFIIRWPGKVPSGKENDDIIAAIDLLPSLAHACGINLPESFSEGQRIDGMNVWETLIEQKGFKHPRNELLFWHGMNGFQAIRIGDWKLFLEVKDVHLREFEGNTALFNLNDEKNELTDLSQKYPEKVKAMKSRAEELVKDVIQNSMQLGKE